MDIDTIAIIAPGDMGHAVGRVLGGHGHRIITCLAGRSERTRALARDAGIADVPDLEALVREASLVLSILPPAAAAALAEDVAGAMRRAGAAPPYADCNAVSPATARAIARVIGGAGAPFIDAGIIGLAPGKGTQPPRFYVSGGDTVPMTALDGKGIEVLAIGAEPGRASGLKMCYAGLTKGTWTLQTAVLLTAERLGLGRELADEFSHSQAAALKQMEDRVPRLPADSARWIGEMEEIAATFGDAGVTPAFHEGAAEIFRVLARTPFAGETRETMDRNRTLADALPVFARELGEG